MMEILFLSTYHPSYIKPLKKWAGILRDGGFRVIERYRDTTYKEDVLEEIGFGRDLLVYFGHGIPGAWCGYGTIDYTDFHQVHPHRYIKTVLSFSCYSLSRHRGPSIGDVFIRHLKAKEFAGFKGRIPYSDNLQCFEAIMLHLLQGDILNAAYKVPVPLRWMRAKEPQANKGR